MSKITVSQLFIYPVKSTFRISREAHAVNQDGLKYDRMLAIVNQAGQILTARENRRLFSIQTAIADDKIIFHSSQLPSIEYALLREGEQQTATLFNRPIQVVAIHHPINDWLSEILGEFVQLAWMDEEIKREIKPKYGGTPDDFIQFQDAAPVHLVAASSLDVLNEKLDRAISIHHFRPNIVVQGSEAYTEDNWRELTIGECIFEVATKTGRCSMTTIHPETQKVNSQQEPLRTLSTFRRETNKINFGIYLIPRKLGNIRIGDEVFVR